MALTKAEKKATSEKLDTVENALRDISATDRQPIVNAHTAIDELRADLGITDNGDED